jgi:hypothetical protein
MIWDDAHTVAFDFESSGQLPEYALQPWRLHQGKFWATSISVIMRTTSLTPWMSKLWPSVDDMRAFLEAAIDNDWLVVMWNGVFDVSILIAYGLRDLVYKVRWLDGLLLWKHLEIDPEYDVDKPKKKSYSLKPDAVDRFIPGFADTTGADDVDFHSRDPQELAKLQHYNNRDSVRTWVITKLIWEQLTERQREAALIEAEAIPMVAEANLGGMPIDTIFSNELSTWLKDTAVKRLAELEPHGLAGPAMVRSPKQLAELMYDVWKLPVLKENTGKKTGTVSRSTDKESLYELAFLDPRCKLLKEYRESLNNDTKFATAPLVSAEYNGDGRTRPQCIMFGTYTGRCTYASKQGKNKDARQIGFALHQEKRGGEYRGILCAPSGYTMVEFDAAGQEFRWMAVLSGDPNMLQLCQPGEDSHAFMGARIVGKDYRFLQEPRRRRAARRSRTATSASSRTSPVSTVPASRRCVHERAPTTRSRSSCHRPGSSTAPIATPTPRCRAIGTARSRPPSGRALPRRSPVAAWRSSATGAATSAGSSRAPRSTTRCRAPAAIRNISRSRSSRAL